MLEEFYEKTREFVIYISNHPTLERHKVDCIDALCLAVSGFLGLKNGFVSVPKVPEKDARGLEMQIVYGAKERVYTNG